MKRNLKYFDGDEINVSFEENESVKIEFFFEKNDYSITKTKLYKAYRIIDDSEIVLEDYKFIRNVLGMESLYFKMPKEDIYLKYTFIDNDSVGTLTIYDDNILDFEYGNELGDNPNFKSFVTDALFSDDYDIGLTDHYFYKNPSVFSFHLNKDLKIQLYLKKDVNIVLELNGISYESSSKEIKEIRNNWNEKSIVYIYKFVPIKFEKSGIAIFKVKQ